MAKTPAPKQTADIFDETPVAKTPVAETPVAETPVAETTLPEGCVYLEALDLYVIKADGKASTFATLAEVHDFLNSSTIDGYTEQFMAYVNAHMAEFFMVEAKPASTSKKAKVADDGTVIPAGTVTPASPARMMDGMALESAQTRLRKAARQVFAWQVRNQI